MKRPSLALLLAPLCLALGCGASPDALEAPAAEPAPEISAQTYLGYTTDQCSGQLRVLDKDGHLITVPRGQLTRVNVGIYRFRWYCGSTPEFTSCDVGTRYVLALHSTQSRLISWQCHY